MRPDALRIALIDDNPVRAAILEEGLREAGHSDITRLRTSATLLRELSVLDPDMVIIDLGNPSRDSLEQMFQLSRQVPRPIAMFVDQSDSSMIEAAVEAGVSAYIVDGLKKERIKPILDMSISRFRAFAKLKGELAEARTELEERKVVDRAKGILMQRRNIAEPEAYALLRRTAMNENRRLADVAQSVVTAAELLK
jgi:two-component system, response regulator / RNA-binding antiterminator